MHVMDASPELKELQRQRTTNLAVEAQVLALKKDLEKAKATIKAMTHEAELSKGEKLGLQADISTIKADLLRNQYEVARTRMMLMKNKKFLPDQAFLNGEEPRQTLLEIDKGWPNGLSENLKDKYREYFPEMLE